MELTKLQERVINQLGYDELTDECKETLSDISNHGASGGFSGFIYYSETLEFFNNNKTEILDHLETMAYDLGEETFKMVTGFGAIKDNNLTTTDIAKAIYESDDENEGIVKNVLTWYALEETAHAITEH